MTIQWFGHNYIKIQGKTTTIVFDPFGKETGLKVPKLQGNIICYSSMQTEKEEVKEAMIIDGPGEFEIGGTFIFGFQTMGPQESSNTVYMAEMDDIFITHLGNLSGPISEDVLEVLRKTHVLFVPVGGHDALNAKQARDIIGSIDPSLVIPIHYKIDGLQADLDPIDVFAKEMGINPKETQEKVKVSKKELSQEKTDFAILSV